MHASLCVDESFAHHFVDSTTNIVHLPHPSHLVDGFKLFGNTFPFGVFFYKPKKEQLCVFLHISEVGVELEQIAVQAEYSAQVEHPDRFELNSLTAKTEQSSL